MDYRIQPWPYDTAPTVVEVGQGLSRPKQRRKLVACELAIIV